MARGAERLEILKVERGAPVDQLNPMVNVGRRSPAATAPGVAAGERRLPDAAPIWRSARIGPIPVRGETGKEGAGPGDHGSVRRCVPDGKFALMTTPHRYHRSGTRDPPSETPGRLLSTLHDDPRKVLCPSGDAPDVGAEVRTGTSSWTSEAWWGRVYPEGTPPADRLGLYARLFDCVEVDATYYTLPTRHMVEAWYSRTPAEFLLTLKVTRDLLDPKKPVDAEKLTGFVSAALILQEKLGPLLLQFPPWVKPGRSTGFLWDLLSALPSGPKYAVELRDAGWYAGETRDRLFRELRDRQMILTWSSLTYVDIPPELTTDEVYLRFIGDHTTIPAETHGEIRADRTAETKRWADRLKRVSNDLRRALVFFNNHYAGFAPESVKIFRELLGLPPVDYGRWMAEGRGGRPVPSEHSPARPRSSRRLDEFG